MLSHCIGALQLHHLPEGLWVGKILLAFSRRQLISGIKYGKKRDVLYTSGVLFQIKKNTKTRYKYEVRRLKCMQNVMLQKKLALLCGRKNKKRFWSEIHRLNHSRLNQPPIVDGVSGSRNIAN